MKKTNNAIWQIFYDEIMYIGSFALTWLTV